MTEVIMEDGSKVETTLPADQVADLQAKPAEPAAEPAKPAEAETPPAKPAAEEPKPADSAKPDEQKPAPEPQKGKAKPIANLLNQRHDLEVKLEASEKSKAELEVKLSELSKQPQSAAKTATIDELAKKHNVSAELLSDLADMLATSTKPELPQEVQDLIAENKRDKEIEAETKAFNNRVDKLATVLTTEPIAEHRDKLMELAYSTELAPDGERYCDKELSELYFGYIKPEIEPGKVSAEASRRAPAAEAKVIDFQEIFDRDDPADIEKMDSETFEKYSKWLAQKAGNVPIKRAQ